LADVSARLHRFNSNKGGQQAMGHTGERETESQVMVVELNQSDGQQRVGTTEEQETDLGRNQMASELQDIEMDQHESNTQVSPFFKVVHGRWVSLTDAADARLRA
jgi:hypothetical protein